MGYNQKILIREVKHGFRTIHGKQDGTLGKNRRRNHLLILGIFVVQDTAGIVVTIIALVPLLAGIFDVCLLAPLFGAPFKGPTYERTSRDENRLLHVGHLTALPVDGSLARATAGRSARGRDRKGGDSGASGACSVRRGVYDSRADRGERRWYHAPRSRNSSPRWTLHRLTETWSGYWRCCVSSVKADVDALSLCHLADHPARLPRAGKECG